MNEDDKYHGSDVSLNAYGNLSIWYLLKGIVIDRIKIRSVYKYSDNIFV